MPMLAGIQGIKLTSVCAGGMIGTTPASDPEQAEQMCGPVAQMNTAKWL